MDIRGWNLTLKQDRLAQAIPNSRTLAEAGLKAGYSAGARAIYKKSTKLHIAKIFEAQGVTRESLREAYNQCLELCRKKEDYSTLKATIDSIAKLYGHLRDVSSTQVQVNVNDTIAKLRSNAPIDVT
jgi:hypothetical protein